MPKKLPSYAGPLLVHTGLKIPVPDILRLCGHHFADILWAFEKFNCDPENLVDWQTMLWHFARDLKARAPGNRPKCRDPTKTAEQACKELFKRKPWNGFKSANNLRRRLAEARKPANARRYKQYQRWMRDYVLIER